MTEASLLVGALRGAPAGTTLAGLPAEGLVAAVEERADDLGPVAAGWPVVLRGAAGPGWLVDLLALLETGASPVLATSDAPEAEVVRMGALAGAVGWLDAGATRATPLAAERATRPAPAARSIVLATSGSTGLPQPVVRPERSLWHEGGRYIGHVGLGPADELLLPLPPWHAYALGWLAAALRAGASVDLVPPSALGRAVGAMDTRATIVALVPSTARLLVRRAGAPAPQADGRLRLAMVGAGPVDDELAAGFRARFGVPLSRNYGSSEMGAVAAGAPDGPAGCVGRAMPGVVLEVRDDAGARQPSGEVGSLHVTVDGTTHRTGDLARLDGAGLHIVGRLTSAVRRGDRWIATQEVEEVLRTAPGVRAAAVRRVHDGVHPDRLVGEVTAVDRRTFDLEVVRAHLGEHLAPSKHPDRIVLRSWLRTTELGKARQPRTYRAGPRWAGPAGAVALALRVLGVADALDGERDIDAVAERLGLDDLVVERLCELAADEGLVEPVDGGPVGDGGTEVDPATAADLAADLVRAARGHPVLRPPDLGPVGEELVPHLRRARRILVGGPVEHLPIPPAAEVVAVVEGSPPATAGDLLVVTSIHGPPPADDLGWVAALVAPGGRLLVVDRFVPDLGGTGLAAEVLARRGPGWPSSTGLEAGLVAAGLAVVAVAGDDPALVLAERPGRADGADADG